jgi:hypothetical protein
MADFSENNQFSRALVFVDQDGYDQTSIHERSLAEVIIVNNVVVKNRKQPIASSEPLIVNGDITAASQQAGPSFHELAMRTAAGPENWFPENAPDGSSFVSDLFTYIQAARQLDRWKSLLIYGKPKDEKKFDILPDHTDVIHGFDHLVGDGTLVHSILGIASEGGELIEHLFTLAVTGTANPEGIQEETGDLDWFQELLADAIGVSVDDTQAQVIAKLAKRYPERYNQSDAILRKDKNGDSVKTNQ